MKQLYFKSKNGFTLIEMLVVIALIAMLSLVIFSYVFQGREESRDITRISDLDQVKLALKLYKEANGSYPDYPDGATIGIGDSIDEELRPFLANLDGDPLSGKEGYEYFYHPSFECNGVIKTVVVAISVEHEKNSNYGEVCNVTPYNSFMNMFMPTAHAGGKGGGGGGGGGGSTGTTKNGCTTSLPKTSNNNCNIDINASITSLPEGGGNVILCWESDPNKSEPRRTVKPIGWASNGDKGWKFESQKVKVTKTQVFTYTTKGEKRGECTDSVTVTVAEPPPPPDEEPVETPTPIDYSRFDNAYILLVN